MQITSTYQHPSGQQRMRVTTQAINQTDTTKGLDALSRGFDQEAAAVLTARLVSHRARTEVLLPLPPIGAHLLEFATCCPISTPQPDDKLRRVLRIY